MLAAERSSLLRVGLDDTEELCASIVSDTDAWFVVVLLSIILLDEEDTNADDALGNIAEERTFADNVEACVLVKPMAKIEFSLEDRFAECDNSDLAEVFTEEVVICDGFGATALSPVAKAEDVLTVELADSAELDLTEPLAVLVDCKLETRFVLTVVTSLDAGAGF